MPTKPTSTFTHATDPNFLTGPASGSSTTAPLADPAQGFVPGSAVAAETVNLPLKITGQWITDWIEQGSSSADLDAHIIETASDGTASIAALNAGGTASTFNAITAIENSGATATTILGTNSSGGIGVGAIATGGGVGMSADVFDTCDGMIGQVRGSGVGVTGRVFAGGTGSAIKGTGSVVGGPTLELEFDATNPVRGQIAIQNTQVPTAPVDGDIWKVASTLAPRRGALQIYDALGAPGSLGPGPMRLWATPEGVEYFQTTAAGPFDSPDETTIVTVASLTIPSGKPNGTYSLSWSLEMQGVLIGGVATFGYLAFLEDGVVVREMAVDLALAPASTWPGTAQQGIKIVTGHYLYTRSAPGATLFEIQFSSVPSSSGLSEGARVTNVTMDAIGVFD